jgi:hypothetical protein
VFWEDTWQPVGRGSECRATHTYTIRTYVRTVHVYCMCTIWYKQHYLMVALVRIQAYVLADIEVAIPAVDLAVEAVV